MDVTGWTIDQRMRFPDWCFGTRQVISCYLFNTATGTRKWTISNITFPNPFCIWQASFVSMPTTGGKGNIRIGMATTVPTSEAEMNAVEQIFPDLGDDRVGPNDIPFHSGEYAYFSLDCRKGVEAVNLKLVMELHSYLGSVRGMVNLVVSCLPTDMAGWLAHNKI